MVSGRAHDYLAKRANDHLQVKKIWGFTIVTEDNEVRNFRTLLANVKGALTGGWPQNIKTYFEIADSFRPDVVISDFESWSYLYGVNHGLPVISVDNIQIVNRCQHDKDVIAGLETSFQIWESASLAERISSVSFRCTAPFNLSTALSRRAFASASIFSPISLMFFSVS